MTASMPANASSPANISPVGPPPAITTSWSVIATLRRSVRLPRPAHLWTAREHLLTDPVSVGPGPVGLTSRRALSALRGSLRQAPLLAVGWGWRRTFVTRWRPRGVPPACAAVDINLG